MKIFESGILFGLLFCCTTIFSQTHANLDTISNPKSKVEKATDIGIDGMFGVSIGDKTIGINVGGPSLKFRFRKFKVGVAAMPSLFIRDEKAIPRLAVGPVAEYEHWMLIVPYYGYDADDRQIWTFGVGYKFF